MILLIKCVWKRGLEKLCKIRLHVWKGVGRGLSSHGNRQTKMAFILNTVQMLPNLTKPHAPEAFISQNKKGGKAPSTVVDLQYLDACARALKVSLPPTRWSRANDKHYGTSHLHVPQASFCPCVNMYLCLRTSLLLEGSLIQWGTDGCEGRFRLCFGQDKSSSLANPQYHLLCLVSLVRVK